MRAVGIGILAFLALTGCAGRRPCCPRSNEDATDKVLPSTAISVAPLPALVASSASAPSGPHYRVDIRIVQEPQGKEVAEGSLCLEPGHVGTLDAVASTPYVADVDVTKSGGVVTRSEGVATQTGGVYIADPIVDVLQEGLAIELCAAPSRDGEATTWLAWRATTSGRLGALRSARLRCSRRGPSVEVQLPTRAVMSSVGVRTVEPDADVVLGRMSHPSGRADLAIHVRVAPGRDVDSVAWTPQSPSTANERARETPRDLPIGPTVLGLDALLDAAVSAPSEARRLRVELLDVPPGAASATAAGTPTRPPGSRVLQVLTLTSAPVAGVMSQLVRQHAYVQDYEIADWSMLVRPSAEGAGVPPEEMYDPIIGTLQDGTSMSLESVDGKLGLEIVFAELVQPVPSFATTLGSRQPVAVTIELPELRLQRATVDLPASRAFHPVGKRIVHGPRGDEVRSLGVWIENTTLSASGR